jgi:MYXO-CTERM domain-containing protein
MHLDNPELRRVRGDRWKANVLDRSILVAFLVGLWLAPAAAQAHALWLYPAPRDQQDGYKDPPRAPPGTGAPCGIGRASSQPVTSSLVPGQPLTVSWRETVDHPGCFVIDFAQANDASFTVLGVKSHANPPKPSTPRDWSVDVTLPNVSCSACTLRLRQLMLSADLPDAQCPPSTIPAGATYYSCANVQLGDGSSQPDAAVTSDAGGGGGGDVNPPKSGSDAGGGCSAVPTAPASAITPMLIIAALVLLRRRRRV